MKRVVVLGCGLVGGAIARDLAAEKDFEVTAVDSSEETFRRLESESRVGTRRADLSSPGEVGACVREADVVVGALPGALGRPMLESVLEAGKPIADISFAGEDPLALDPLARQKGVTAVVDCGVSPGLSNFAVGRAAARLDEVEEVKILVGGLPSDRRSPYGYAAVFSVADVIEEYTRPARIVEEGRVVARPALSEVESVEVPGVGRLEAFLTDGLRTLLSTVPAKRMTEKTLRYPGHAERMRELREAGFFDEAPLDLTGARVSPRALAERLLSRAWKLREGEEEFTYLRVIVTGRESARFLRQTFELFDRTDRRTGMTSMARTTAFPCAILARMLARGQLREPGVLPPEMLGKSPRVAESLIAELRARGLRWEESTEEIGRI